MKRQDANSWKVMMSFLEMLKFILKFMLDQLKLKLKSSNNTWLCIIKQTKKSRNSINAVLKISKIYIQEVGCLEIPLLVAVIHAARMLQ